MNSNGEEESPFSFSWCLSWRPACEPWISPSTETESVNQPSAGMENRTMKIHVTGSTGKVGSVVLKELLKRGADVRVFVRKNPAV